MSKAPSYPQQHTTVVVQPHPQQQTVYVQPRQTHGLLGELKSAGSSLLKETNKAAGEVWKAVDPQGYQTHKKIHEILISNNVIQLVSRCSGHTLQIVQSPDDRLVIDGRGAEGPQPQFYNTHWTVIRESGNTIRLHNNCNYLAIVQGHVCVMFCPVGTPPGIESRFHFYEMQNFVCLESERESGRYVGVNPDGSMKSAVATGRSDTNAHFGLRLIHSPFGIVH